MGRPAFSWRVTPGDHGTEGSEDPPTMVTALSGAMPKHEARQNHWDPKRVVQLLAGPDDKQDSKQRLPTKRQHIDQDTNQVQGHISPAHDTK